MDRPRVFCAFQRRGALAQNGILQSQPGHLPRASIESNTIGQMVFDERNDSTENLLVPMENLWHFNRRGGISVTFHGNE
jgi:hypothetical protein